MPLPLSIMPKQVEMLERGKMLTRDFCRANNLPIPTVKVVPVNEWMFGVCAFYRPDTPVNKKWSYAGISICLEKCARLATESEVRNWNWPGSVTDREPYGVIAHELGHHVDWCAGEKKGSYFSEYGIRVRNSSGEKPISSYCPNPAEWFAEMFRVFVTNDQLLKLLRPNTWKILMERWVPVRHESWADALNVGGNPPTKILDNLQKKIRVS